MISDFFFQYKLKGRKNERKEGGNSEKEEGRKEKRKEGKSQTVLSYNYFFLKRLLT